MEIIFSFYLGLVDKTISQDNLKFPISCISAHLSLYIFCSVLCSFIVSVCSNGKYGFITVNLLELFKRLLYNFSLNIFYCPFRSFVITQYFWRNICTFLLYYFFILK